MGRHLRRVAGSVHRLAGVVALAGTMGLVLLPVFVGLAYVIAAVTPWTVREVLGPFMAAGAACACISTLWIVVTSLAHVINVPSRSRRVQTQGFEVPSHAKAPGREHAPRHAVGLQPRIPVARQG